MNYHFYIKIHLLSKLYVVIFTALLVLFFFIPTPYNVKFKPGVANLSGT